jgi:Ca2+-binding RTX toxin-like protein
MSGVSVDLVDGGGTFPGGNFPDNSGNDTIIGGGSDSVLAGDGNDWVDDKNTSSPVGGDDIVYGGSGDDTMSGQAGNDYLVGDEGSDSLNGNFDDDTLIGEAGNDSLRAGGGSDSLEGAMNLATGQAGWPIR